MTTTDYGTWNNQVDPWSHTVEQTVEEAFGSGGPEGYDVDAIVGEYLGAIERALDKYDIALAGANFYGPYPAIEVDIGEIIHEISLPDIIERHAL